MDLRGVTRIATDITLTTVRWPIAPAARATGLEQTVARLDADARDAVGRVTGDRRLQAEARALRCRCGATPPPRAPSSPRSPRARTTAR